MGWDNTFETDMTLPSGATTGARIFLDGTAGTILVYDANNVLIASIAPMNTNDAAGNTVLQGITDYGQGGQFARLLENALQLGFIGAPDTVAYGEIQAGSTSIAEFTSPRSTGWPVPVTLTLASGATGSTTGTAGYPLAKIQDADLMVAGGTVIPGIEVPFQGITPETWHRPTLSAGWAPGSTAAARYADIRYRLTGLDSVHICGALHSTVARAAGPYGLFTLTGAYVPKDLYPDNGDHVSSTDAWKTSIRVNVDSLGGAVGISTNAAIAIGDNFYINTIVPLGNIPVDPAN